MCFRAFVAAGFLLVLEPNIGQAADVELSCTGSFSTGVFSTVGQQYAATATVSISVAAREVFVHVTDPLLPDTFSSFHGLGGFLMLRLESMDNTEVTFRSSELAPEGNNPLFLGSINRTDGMLQVIRTPEPVSALHATCLPKKPLF
jgi:hypothetical protein